MEDVVKIIERLGSLGILVILIWRVPAILDSLTAHTAMAIDKIVIMQDKTLTMYKEQQTIERSLMINRFESVDRTLEKVCDALESNMKIQNETLVTQNEIKHRLERLEDRK